MCNNYKPNSGRRNGSLTKSGKKSSRRSWKPPRPKRKRHSWQRSVLLLGSGKLKELEADNRTLQGEVAARDESIELLQRQMQRQQENHQRQLMELQVKHRRELSDKEAEQQKKVSFLKSIIQKCPKVVSAVSRTGVHGEVLP